MEGIKQNLSGNDMNGADIFSQFFGGGGGRRDNRRRRTKNICRDLPVELAELYTGKLRKFKITHKIICPDCKGRGGSEGCESICSDCNGNGVRVVRIRRGNMIQQYQNPCETCNSTGKIIDPKKRCSKCEGNKVIPDTIVVEAQVERGMKDGSKIILRSAADEAPDADAGDIVYTVKEKKHRIFTRNGPDLSVTRVCTLAEALCGFRFYLPHLDGRKLLIEIKQGDIINPNSVKVIRNEGMPVRGAAMTYGSLFIFFSIKFPLPQEIKDYAAIARCLNKEEDIPLDPNAQLCAIEDSNKDLFGKTVKEPQIEEDERVSIFIDFLFYRMMMMMMKDILLLVNNNNLYDLYFLLVLFVIRKQVINNEHEES